MESKIDKMEKKTVQMEKEANRREEQMKEIKEEYEEMKEIYERMEKEKREMEVKIKELEEKCENMNRGREEKDRVIKELKEEVAEVKRKEKEDTTARDELVAKMLEVEEKATKRTAEGATPNHDMTNQTFAEVVNRTHKQLKEEMKETFKELIIESNQFTNNHARNVRAPRHTKTELVIFGMEEKIIPNRDERKCKETETIHEILKAIDKDWDSTGLTDHYRVGRYIKNSPKPRPTKIIFDNNERMFNFLIKSKNLKDSDKFTHIRAHKSLNKEDLEILKGELKVAERNNNERSEKEKNEFFWAIRGLTAKKIPIRQNSANEPATTSP